MIHVKSFISKDLHSKMKITPTIISGNFYGSLGLLFFNELSKWLDCFWHPSTVKVYHIKCNKRIIFRTTLYKYRISITMFDILKSIRMQHAHQLWLRACVTDDRECYLIDLNLNSTLPWVLTGLGGRRLSFCLISLIR